MKKSISVIMMCIFLLIPITINVTAESNNSMSVGSYFAYPDQQLIITVDGTWDEEITLYSVLLYFRIPDSEPDGTEITVTDANLNGCIDEDANLVLTDLDLSHEPYLIMVQASILLSNPLPAGSGTLLNISVDVSENATPGVVQIDLNNDTQWTFYSTSDSKIVTETNDGELEILNHPPEIPTIDGPSEGFIDNEYTYELSSSDSEEDDIWYMIDWGDDTPLYWIPSHLTEGIISVSHSWNLQGTYNVKSKAQDAYAETDWSDILTVEISTEPLDPVLIISINPTIVTEDELFIVKVKDSNGDRVDGAYVEFDRQIQQTDPSGETTFIASSVDEKTSFTISVQHDDYEDAVTAKITVLAKPADEVIGWIWGTTLEDAEICVILEDGTKKCAFSDENGVFIIEIPIGTYTVEASKTGYEKDIIDDVEVLSDKAIQLDFTLVESGDGPNIDENREIIDDAIKTGTIGAEITIQKQETDDEIEISQTKYADITISEIDINPEDKQISLVVDGEIDTGKTIVFEIDQDVISIENILVEYDEISIKEAADFIDIINPLDDGSLPEYYVLEDKFLLVSMPHFSEHTITISSIVEALGGITAIISYVVICAISVILFAGIIFIRRRMF